MGGPSPASQRFAGEDSAAGLQYLAPMTGSRPKSANFGNGVAWEGVPGAHPAEPKTDLSRAFLADALGHLGEAEEARSVWGELAEVNPMYSFADHMRRLPFRNRADADRMTEGLRKAGIAV